MVTMSLASDEIATRLRFCQYRLGLDRTVT
jgi:hypothetical protein